MLEDYALKISVYCIKKYIRPTPLYVNVFSLFRNYWRPDGRKNPCHDSHFAVLVKYFVIGFCSSTYSQKPYKSFIICITFMDTYHSLIHPCFPCHIKRHACHVRPSRTLNAALYGKWSLWCESSLPGAIVMIQRQLGKKSLKNEKRSFDPDMLNVKSDKHLQRILF